MSTFLKNKVVVISGASRGIGRAAALKIAEQGAKVMAFARDKDAIDKLVAEAHTLGIDIHGFDIDISDEAQVKSLIEKVLDRFGRIDILVNNAGYGVFKNAEDFSLEEWNQLMATNLTGIFLTCKYAIPAMKKAGNGHILNIASDVAKRTFAMGSLYTASKYGVEAYSGAIRKELRPFNIKVSVIYSGLVDSHFHAKGHGHETSKNYLTEENMADAFIYVLNQPQHVVIDELMIHPISQEY